MSQPDIQRIYDILDDIRDRMARLEEKSCVQPSACVRIQAELDTVKSNVQTLLIDRAKRVGAMAVITVCGSAIGGVIVVLVEKLI